MFKIILILSLLSLFQVVVHSQGKVSVHILYESLCPDSIKFINEQLYPIWSEVSPYVNINFVPFGKSASLNGGSEFMCQHGPKECVGNKIQSCVLNALVDQNAQVEYVYCFMNTFKNSVNNHNDHLGRSCAEGIGLPWDYVTRCNDSIQGTRLQLQAEEITNQIAPKFVPTILFNGRFHQEAQDESQTNFRGVLCSFIKQLNPVACN